MSLREEMRDMMTVHEVSKRTGVSIRALRLYAAQQMYPDAEVLLPEA